MIAQTDNTGDTKGAGLGEQSHVWTPDGIPLASYQTSGDSWWYTHDALGSVTDVTTGTGTPITSKSYTLFGEQTLTDHRTSPTNDPVNPGFGYTSGFNHLADPELHLRARDYDPAQARFTNPDPLSPDHSAAAFTTYRYANNSPLVYIDPTGEWGLDINGAWQRLKDAGSTIATTAQNVGIGLWDQTTNHVGACAERDKSECGHLFLDIATLGTAEVAAADLSGCANQDLASCGWLWVDIATLGLAGGAAVKTTCTSVRRAKVAANTASRFGTLAHASSGIAPYSSQRLITAGHGGAIQAHHLVEKRFAAVMGQNTADMLAIVVTRAEHQVFTNAWRQTIPHGSRNVTPDMVKSAARNIYRDYPEILQALGLG